MRIIETLPGNTDFDLFEKVLIGLYSEQELELKSQESIPVKFLINCFVLLIDDAPVGRVSLYLNPELKYEGKTVACLGNFECIENNEAANSILQYVEEKARELNAEHLLGPMSGSTWENYRFSTDHKHPNFFLEPYHLLYYNDQFMQNGFESIADYHSLLDKEVIFKIPGAESNQAKFEKEGITFREVNLADFENELAQIHDLNETAYKTNFLYTPIDKVDFIAKYVKAKQFINSDFLRMAFDQENRLVAYYFCTPDYFNKTEKSLIIKSIARNPDDKYRGLGQVIGNQIYSKAKAQGYTSIIHAFMYNDGTSAPLSKQFAKNPFKNYKLYGKAL